MSDISERRSRVFPGSRPHGLLCVPKEVRNLMPIRILVADDNECVRSAISELIRNSDANWVVCCEANNGKVAVEKAAETKPDVVILDLVMPGLDGINAGRKIRALLPDVPIIMYSLL